MMKLTFFFAGFVHGSVHHGILRHGNLGLGSQAWTVHLHADHSGKRTRGTTLLTLHTIGCNPVPVPATPSRSACVASCVAAKEETEYSDILFWLPSQCLRNVRRCWGRRIKTAADRVTHDPRLRVKIAAKGGSRELKFDQRSFPKTMPKPTFPHRSLRFSVRWPSRLRPKGTT